MSDPIDETKEPRAEFDFSAFPPDSVFHERRTGLDRRDRAEAPPREPLVEKAPRERRARKERRKRIDPTTFEKQYTDDELEFMTAVQRFKERSGRPFPTYREVLGVAASLGYRRVVIDESYQGGEFSTAAVKAESEFDPRPDQSPRHFVPTPHQPH